MKRIILLSALLVIFVFQLSAQTKSEKIKELFVTMRVDETMKSMMDNMSGLMQQQARLYGNVKKDSIHQGMDSSYINYVKEEVVAFTKK